MRVNPVHYHHQEADVQRTLRLGFSLSNPSLLMNCLRFAWQQYFMMRKTQSLWMITLCTCTRPASTDML